MYEELDNLLPTLQTSGSHLPEVRRAHLDAEVERRGLPLRAIILDVLADSEERGRRRLVARYCLPGDPGWDEVGLHLDCIQWLVETGLPQRDGVRWEGFGRRPVFPET